MKRYLDVQRALMVARVAGVLAIAHGTKEEHGSPAVIDRRRSVREARRYLPVSAIRTVVVQKSGAPR